MSGNVNVFTATATDNTGSAFKSVQNNIKRTKEESEKLNGSLRMMRGGFGQLGHQVQDVAVQLQMGQNPLMVLTQQGSQVASLFGPTGAIIGAVGAVAGALASAIIPNLFESAGAAGELERTVGSLSALMNTEAKTGITEYAGKLKELSHVSESAANNLMMMANVAALKDLRTYRNEIEAVKDEFLGVEAFFRRYGSDELGDITGAKQLGLQVEQFKELRAQSLLLGTSIGMTNEEFGALLNSMMPKKLEDVNEEFLKMTSRFFKAHGGMALLNGQLDQFNNAGLPGTVSDTVTEFDKLIERIEKLNDKTNKLSPAEQIARQIKGNKDLTSEQKRQALERLREIDLVRMQSDAVDALTKARIKDEREAEKARRQRESEEQRGIAAGIKDKEAKERERLKTEQKLEGMRTGFLSELDLISQQESQRLGFVKGLDDSFFDATRTREDMITMIERDSALQRMRIAEEEQEKKQKIAEAGQQVVLQGLQMMASSFAEGTAAQKTAFLAYKSFAAAEAVISAELAAAKMLAMGVGIFGLGAIPASNLVRGMGYASAAIIMAQAVASFEGGGFTGRGARSGGIDGKGGFFGLLHPNEKITDMHNGGGSGITIINNVDATGAGPEVDQKIRTAMEKTSRTTIQTVRDLAGRGRLV
jgi:hypothetical protein